MPRFKKNGCIDVEMAGVCADFSIFVLSDEYLEPSLAPS
jgi:hypothetical protein